MYTPKFKKGEAVVPTWMDVGAAPCIVDHWIIQGDSFVYYLKFGSKFFLHVPESELELPDPKPYEIALISDTTGEEFALLKYNKQDYDTIMGAALKQFIVNAVKFVTNK